MTNIARIPAFAAFFILALMFSPLNVAEAASTKGSCLLTIETPRGEVDIKKKGEVLVLPKERVTISWEGRNVKKAKDTEGDSVALSGSKVVSVSETETFTYHFLNGKKKIPCSVTLRVVDGSIDADSLSTNQAKPSLSGEASGTKTVRVSIENSSGKRVFLSKDIKIKKGAWKTKVTKSLPTGTYLVTLTGVKTLEINTIATGTLTVREKGTSASTHSDGSLSVSMVPFLTGGNAAPGSSVPVAYVKLVNTGKTPTSIKGFTLIQQGSASTDAVVGFAVNDDKGGSRAILGGNGNQFKKMQAYVPLAADFAPGQLRIFTIKAMLGTQSGSYAGTQLKLAVGSVDTDASLPSVFPIPGTTWTLTR